MGILKTYIQELRKKYNEDSALIQAAIEIGKTRTNLPNRGKGLSQIIHELKKLPNANVSVSILSNNGGFMSKSLKFADSILIPFNDSNSWHYHYMESSHVFKYRLIISSQFFTTM